MTSSASEQQVTATTAWNVSTPISCQSLSDAEAEANYTGSQGTLFCPAVFDGYLCWPKSLAGQNVQMPCPNGIPGLDPEKFVYRFCQPDGHWFSCDFGTAANASSLDAEEQAVVGWTNYSHCLTATTSKLMAELNFEPTCANVQKESDGTVEIKMLIAQISRILEMVGYSLSLVFLTFALSAFCYFRKLRKPRVTRIHMNLFASMILQSFIRIVIYVDQLIVRQSGLTLETTNHTYSSSAGYPANADQNHQPDLRVWGIDNTPFLCQTFYTLIEYGKTTMFLWMFIEGIILYHMTTVAYSRGPENQMFFYLCGWLIPMPLTAVWLVTMMLDEDADSIHCGQGYSFLSSYWILEGPRIAVIMMNVLILLNVVRVLFTHLSGNETPDIHQIRKSLKSLLFLLPLLGITNVLHFVWPNPLRGTWVSFAVWSITSHFLYSFQGVFVASVYFLFDDKVKDTLYKFWVLKVRLRDFGAVQNSKDMSVICHMNELQLSSNNRYLRPSQHRAMKGHVQKATPEEPDPQVATWSDPAKKRSQFKLQKKFSAKARLRKIYLPGDNETSGKAHFGSRLKSISGKGDQLACSEEKAASCQDRIWKKVLSSALVDESKCTEQQEASLCRSSRQHTLSHSSMESAKITVQVTVEFNGKSQVDEVTIA